MSRFLDLAGPTCYACSMTNIVESMFHAAVRDWLAREVGIVAEEIVEIEQDKQSGTCGYGTCGWDEVVIEITYRREGCYSSEHYTYVGDLGAFIRALG